MTTQERAGGRLFLQFAGQGTRYMDALRNIYRSTPAVRSFILEAVETIKEQAALYDDGRTRFFSEGLAVDRWLEHAEKTPSFAYLMSSPLSYPLIFLCQMAAYLAIFGDGLEAEELLGAAHSATGFSTGIIPALLASMGLPPPELSKRALQAQAMFVWAGIRVQSVTHDRGVHLVLAERARGDDVGCPSCMAAIGDLSPSAVEEAIAAFGRGGAVSLAYEQSATRSVVAGMPEDLEAFHDALRGLHEGFSWRYVLSTTAAHSPYHEPVLSPLVADADRLGLDFDAREMKLPVWSVESGQDLRGSRDLRRRALRGFLLDRGSWPLQVAALAGTEGISHVLDFGPGGGVSSLTESVAGASGCQVLRCGVPMGRMIFAKTVAPKLKSEFGAARAAPGIHL